MKRVQGGHAEERMKRHGSGMHVAKPRLRGWFHAVAAVASVVVTLALLVQTHDDRIRFFSLLIFGLSMIELYVVSAIYHMGTWQGRRYHVLRAADHANIFVLIAGTYTPICVNVLTGWLRVAVLGLIWSLAVVGVISAVATMRLPRWISTALYIGMGWIALVTLPWLIDLLPWQALAFFAAGGALYTMGAVVYALRRPDPFPHLFGFHEIFHLFTIAGNAAFVLVIWLWVVPFPRI